MYEAVNFKKDMIDGCVKSLDPSVAYFHCPAEPVWLLETS